MPSAVRGGAEPLKVHKHENFLGSDYDFLIFFLWLLMPNYYFLEKNLHWTNNREATIIPRILSIRGKRLSCKLGETLKKTQINFVKIVLQHFVLLNAPEFFFTHFQTQNQIQLSLY